MSRDVPAERHALPASDPWRHPDQVSSETTAGAGIGLSGPVLAAGVCFVLGGAATAVLLRILDGPPTGLALIGWPLFALTAAVLFDRRQDVPLARVASALALVPLAVLGLAVVQTGIGAPTGADAFETLGDTAALQAVAVLVGLPCALRPARSRSARAVAAALAVAGALSVAITGGAGWAAVVVGCAWVWVDAARGAWTDGRTPRRRMFWLLALLSAAAAAVAVSWSTLPRGTAAGLTATCVGLVAVGVARLCVMDSFRPLDEPFLDVLLVVAAVVAAAGVAVVVRAGSALTNMPSPDTYATMAAVFTAATTAPAALSIRRAVLARRYGAGTIAPADVAVITADLHARTDPRELLDKAARMVAAASGCREARLVLGEELPETGPGWLVHPLDVGGERVGALAVGSASPEGPEPRQADAVARLVPTVALVARAVGLAVEAELARRDVARERDLERRRILADLHDGLGPVLAGMSMRVRAALRANGSGVDGRLLADLADGLGASRAELRSIVSDITPSALDGADLGSALEHLVASFGREADRPALSLDVALDTPVDEPVRVAVYRCVAEGVTNALRHAGATTIAVRVASAGATVTVDVQDDGAGGPIVPGVGLASLRARAAALGGTLRVEATRPRGTRLHLELPTVTTVEMPRTLA